MTEKGKISSLQMGIMMNPTILATAILIVPGITAAHAKLDLWISPVWASLIGLLTVFIAVKLNNIFPDETVIQYSQRILGRMPGRGVGLVILLFYLHVTGIIIREYAEFVAESFLVETPIIVIMGSLTLVCAYAVRTGVEVLGRLAELIVPGIIIILLLIIILISPDLKPEKMLPVLENGWMPSILGAVTPQGWFSEYFLISFLLPFLADREKALKSGMLSVFSVMLIMVVLNLAILFLFGEGTANVLYPVMAAVRYISIADFLEHLESLVMAIWVAGGFIKISVFYYCLTLGTAQWLKLSDYRPIVVPIGILTVLIAVWSAPEMTTLGYVLGTTLPFYLTSVQTVIPLFLLIVAVLRKRENRGKPDR